MSVANLELASHGVGSARVGTAGRLVFALAATALVVALAALFGALVRATLG